MTSVIATVSDGIATIQMQDPKRRNVLSESMLTELIASFDQIGPGTRAVILRAGDADPVWCAGFDIRAIGPGHDPLHRNGLLQTLFGRIADFPAPVIAMVRGSTWGGGTDLALRCDILVGDTSCQFAFTPARLGLPYDGEGLLNVLLRAGPAVAFEMFATADPIKAERALAVGLLNHLVPPNELNEFTMAMARKIASNAPLSVSSAKRHLRAIAAGLSIPTSVAQALNESRVAALSSDDYREGLAAFGAKRPPTFKGK